MMRPSSAAALSLALAALSASAFAAPPLPLAPSPPPLHQRIDSLIDSAAIGPLAPVCTDADFVRRIYLDLTGVVPTADQARAFIDDKRASNRERLIDELL